MTNLIAQQVNNPATAELSGFTSEELFSKIIGVVLAALFFAGIAIFMFRIITGAVGWITAGADKAKLENSKNTLFHAVIGLVILLMIFGIINFVVQFLGFDITYFNISELGVDY